MRKFPFFDISMSQLGKPHLWKNYLNAMHCESFGGLKGTVNLSNFKTKKI